MNKQRNQKLQEEVKNQIAEAYMEDARDYIRRIDKLLDTEFTHRSNRCKLYVDLLLAVECLMKANITYDNINNNSIDAKGLYNKIKKGGHTIRKLKSLLSNKSQVIFDKCITNEGILDNSDYLIDLRYSIEAKIKYDLSLTTNENQHEPDYYEKIADGSLFINLLKQIEEYVKQIEEYVKQIKGYDKEISNICPTIKAINIRNIDISFETDVKSILLSLR